MCSSFISQSSFIPPPTLTEKNLPDQTGKVHIVTGGYAGVGFELTKILYSRNATVYIAGRSESKANTALDKLHAAHPNSTGRLEFLFLDLADLTTIAKAAKEFMAKEERLDVLTNNAGVMFPPKSFSKQGHEIQMATNCVGPYLFAVSLLPILKRTAAKANPGEVRVTWAGSLGTQTFAPKGGIVMDESGAPKSLGSSTDYGQSKVGNVWLGSEFARRYGKDGILSVSFNPGNLKSELQRHGGWIFTLLSNWMLYPAVFGGYTELYSGWSTDITMEQNGSYIWPWGRPGSLRGDVASGMKSKEDGGSGRARMFWEWSENVTKDYM